MHQKLTTPVARLRSVLIVALLGLSLTVGAGQMAATATVTETRAERGVVGASPAGRMVSTVTGTAGGREVRGEFTPLKFIKRDGKVKVRGLIEGKIGRGETARTFAAMRTLTVKRINGDPVRARTSTAAACDILKLRLGPLDLDLLGLEINLNRIVLDIVARSGAGNLLGNLLCAVAGLLDGGLAGALGRLTRLLNRILGQLGLGL